MTSHLSFSNHVHQYHETVSGVSFFHEPPLPNSFPKSLSPQKLFNTYCRLTSYFNKWIPPYIVPYPMRASYLWDLKVVKGKTCRLIFLSYSHAQHSAEHITSNHKICGKTAFLIIAFSYYSIFCSMQSVLHYNLYIKVIFSLKMIYF